MIVAYLRVKYYYKILILGGTKCWVDPRL